MSSLWEQELVAVDVETTGLDPRADRVIEVAVVRGGPDGSSRSWSTLVDPGLPVLNGHIHGLTDVLLAGAPSFPSVATPLLEQLDAPLLVGHNARFDLDFLEAELGRAGRELPPVRALDTLGLARRCFGLPSNTLAALCEHFAIPHARAHRAPDDARATLALAWRMFAALDRNRRLTVDGAIDLCRRRNAPELRTLYEALLAAQSGEQAVSIDYYAADTPGSGHTRRLIRPLRVGTRRVVAWCYLRDAERTFRLDRMRLADPEDSSTMTHPVVLDGGL